MTNQEIRQKTKGLLKGNLAMASVIILIYGMIAGVGMSVVSPLLSLIDYFELNMAIYWIVYIIGMVATYLIQGAVLLGYANIFLKLGSGQKVAIGELFSCTKHTIKAFKLVFMIGIKIFLWSLLFIVPGILKALSYSMAIYIMAEDPNKDVNECMKESEELMRGKRGQLVGLTMSIVGWLVLGYFALIILIILGAVLGSAVGVAAVILLGLLGVVLIFGLIIASYPISAYLETCRIVFYYSIKPVDYSYDAMNIEANEGNYF